MNNKIVMVMFASFSSLRAGTDGDNPCWNKVEGLVEKSFVLGLIGASFHDEEIGDMADAFNRLNGVAFVNTAYQIANNEKEKCASWLALCKEYDKKLDDCTKSIDNEMAYMIAELRPKLIESAYSFTR